MKGTNKRDYVRVPQKQRLQLIQYVYRQCYKIKEASNILGIKYAAAKTIILKYRKNKYYNTNQYLKQAQIRCTFKSVVSISNQEKFNIITLISGERPSIKEN